MQPRILSVVFDQMSRQENFSASWKDIRTGFLHNNDCCSILQQTHNDNLMTIVCWLIQGPTRHEESGQHATENDLSFGLQRLEAYFVHSGQQTVSTNQKNRLFACSAGTDHRASSNACKGSHTPHPTQSTCAFGNKAHTRTSWVREWSSICATPQCFYLYQFLLWTLCPWSVFCSNMFVLTNNLKTCFGFERRSK